MIPVIRAAQLDCKIVMTCFFAPNPALAPVLVFSHITSRGARTLPGQGLVGCCANESCGCEVRSVSIMKWSGDTGLDGLRVCM